MTDKLVSLGFHPTSENNGPDFRIEYKDKVIWIEAIAPLPTGIPQHFLEPPQPGEFRVNNFPSVEILLRYTSGITTKLEQAKKYLNLGIISKKDIFIVAVNGSLLGNMPFTHGISQFPLLIEAVYPVGPVQVSINKKTMDVMGVEHQYRPGITNANKAPVSTECFLSENYSIISAAIGWNAGLGYLIGENQPFILAHNTFAKNKLPEGIFHQATEYTADVTSTEITIHKRETGFYNLNSPSS